MDDNIKAKKMTASEKVLCWVCIVMCSLTVIGCFLAFLPWIELQLDKLDYDDERLAFQRACYPFGVPDRNDWKQFRRGYPGYNMWYN